MHINKGKTREDTKEASLQHTRLLTTTFYLGHRCFYHSFGHELLRTNVAKD